jgi:hypothetical protein
MDLERFARIVYERRIALGLTQQEIADAGGPTDTTMTKIENAEWKPGNRKTTLRKLDVGLQWETGSAQRVLAGGEPTPRDAPRAPIPPPGGWPKRDTTPEQRQQMDDYRIAELPLIYPLLSRDGKLEVAAHGRRIFNHEYKDWTIGEIDALLTRTHDDSAEEQGASGEAGEGEKTESSDDAESGAALDTAQAAARAQLRDNKRLKKQG